MPEVNVLAVLVATIAAFVLSATYYAVLPAQGAEASDGRPAGGQPPPPWKLAVELLRSLIVAAVVAGLARHGDVDGWTGGVVLGLALWIGFRSCSGRAPCCGSARPGSSPRSTAATGS